LSLRDAPSPLRRSSLTREPGEERRSAMPSSPPAGGAYGEQERLVYDLSNYPKGGKAGKIAFAIEEFDGKKAVVYVYGKKPGDKEYTMLVKTEQAVTTTSNSDSNGYAYINLNVRRT